MITAKQMLGVKNEAALRKLAQTQAAKVGADVVESAVPLVASINHGRWIATCQCGGGIACDPSMSIAVCFLHRHPDDPTMSLETRIHTAIVWPPNRGRLEALLNKRGLNRNRHWTADESEADLERENDAFGVGG